MSDVEDLLVEGWSDRRRRRLLADVVWPADLAPTARELARSLAAAGAAPAGEPPAPLRTIGAGALEHVRHREVVSGGALELYADCPVKWFVERELSPDRFELEPDPLARGSYMHAALEELLRRLGGPVTRESLPRARRLLGEVVAELDVPIAPGRSELVRAAALRGDRGRPAALSRSRGGRQLRLATGRARAPLRLRRRGGLAALGRARGRACGCAG